SVTQAAPLARGLGRLAAAPEDFRFDRELVRAAAVGRTPGVLDLGLEPRDALRDQRGLLEIGEIREPQRRRRVPELLDEQRDARPPERAHLDGARLEDRIGHVEPDDAMDRRGEVDLERLAARRALDLHDVARRAEARRQRAIVELQDEVRAAALARRDRAGDVVTAVAVRRRDETAGGREPYTGDTGLARVLDAVAVRVVVDL